MSKSIQQIFNDAIEKHCFGKKLALAVSGGMDSMCLLHLALECDLLAKKNLCVLSVDHGIRGADSKNDLKFVEDFCKSQGIKFVPRSVNVPLFAKKNKQSIELAARECRQNFYKYVVESGLADVVLLGHHADDNVESICLNMFRGAGLKGLVGMQELSHGSLLRPLLKAKKAQIEAFVVGNNIDYVIDNTNSDDNYTRNALRLNVLPAIQKLYPNYVDAVLSLSGQAKDLLNNIKLDSTQIEIDGGIAKISLEALKSKEASYYVIDALEKLGLRQNFYRKNIEMIIELAFLQSGAGRNLPNGLVVVKEYSHVVIMQNANAHKDATDDLPFKLGESCFGGIRLCVDKIKTKQFKKPDRSDVVEWLNKILYFDLDKVPKTAIFRCRQDGDIFAPFGSGNKKLKDFLIDKKIPLRLRDTKICLADGKNILLIVGHEISNSIRVDSSTVNVGTIKQGD